MKISVFGKELYYEKFNGEGIPVLLLHGWGADSKAMSGIFGFLRSQNRTVISLDLPYFGQSQALEAGSGVYEYANIVYEFLKLIEIQNIIVIGHSFGGRLGIFLAAKHNIINKLILIDSAGAKPRRGIKYRLKVGIYKIKKKLGVTPKKSGSTDYRNLPENMKQTFVKIVNTHLDSLFKEIKVPTLLIWGENDKDTPLYMAKRMNKKIAGSGLVVLKNAGHFSYADKFYESCSIINSFLNT